MLSIRKVAFAVLAVATIAGSVTTADARGWGRGYGGRGFGIGAGVATGLAVGALGAGYAYRSGYGYPGYGYGAYGYDAGYDGCVLRRRVHYTPYGPVVRHVRVCY